MSKLGATSAILVGAGGVALFTALLLGGHLGEASYTGLILILAVVCLAILGFPRLREVDLRELRLTLDRVEQARAEVTDKGVAMRKAALAFSELAAVHSTPALQRNPQPLLPTWTSQKVQALLTALDVPPQEQRRTQRMASCLERIEHGEASGGWQDLQALLVEDLRAMGVEPDVTPTESSPLPGGSPGGAGTGSDDTPSPSGGSWGPFETTT